MIDTDKVKDGDTVVVNKNLTGLTKGQQLTARMATRHQVVAENGAGLHVIARGHLDPLPAEPDVMRVFDEAVVGIMRMDIAAADREQSIVANIRGKFLKELHRDPVQRLEAEHGAQVVKSKRGWVGVTAGTDKGNLLVFYCRSTNSKAVREKDSGDPLLESDEGWPDPHACATAILAVLEGGES